MDKKSSKSKAAPTSTETKSTPQPETTTPVTKTVYVPEKKIMRSTTDRMVSGVCGGLAEYFSIDSTIIRLIFVALVIWGGSGLLIYIILSIVLPEESNVNKSTKEIVEENSKQFEKTVENVAANVETMAKERNTQLWIGIFVIALGFVLLGSNYGIFDLGDFIRIFGRVLWPLFVIGLGLLILVKSQRGK